jgi:hypothetical protein
MKNLLLILLVIAALLVAVSVRPVHAGIKVDICHIPPGNPGNAHYISVDESAVPAHLAHGDTAGIETNPNHPNACQLNGQF